MFSILNEIKNSSPASTASVVVASIGSAASVYILVAIIGYLSFGENILGNIVAQFRPSVASTIGSAAIVVLVMFSYPLQVHPCRASVDAVTKWRPIKSKSSQPDLTPVASNRNSPTRSSLLQGKPAGRSKPEDMGELRFAVITTVIIILSYIVALSVSSLDVVLAYVGSTGSTAISFILPGLFYYKISDPDSPYHQRLLKNDEDDEEFEGSSEDSDDATATALSDDVHPASPSWRDVWANHRKGRLWRQADLRKASLALAMYGIVVMVVCLVTNTFFVAAH